MPLSTLVRRPKWGANADHATTIPNSYHPTVRLLEQAGELIAPRRESPILRPRSPMLVLLRGSAPIRLRRYGTSSRCCAPGAGGGRGGGDCDAQVDPAALRLYGARWARIVARTARCCAQGRLAYQAAGSGERPGDR
jgi:hypothetical protein